VSSACRNCGAPPHEAGAVYCTRCGARLHWFLDWLGSEYLGDLFWGIVLVISGLGLYLWAHTHSFLGALTAWPTDPNAYIIEEPFYSLIVLAAALMSLGGIVLIARELIREAKR